MIRISSAYGNHDVKIAFLCNFARDAGFKMQVYHVLCEYMLQISRGLNCNK